jgi:hypothetical protein
MTFRLAGENVEKGQEENLALRFIERRALIH